MAADAKGLPLTVGARAMVLHKHTCTIRFVGKTEFAEGEWVGVELDTDDGKNNGTIKGVCYFTCADSRGLFVRPGGSIEILQSANSAAPPPAQDGETAKSAEGKAQPKKKPGGLLGRIAPRTAKKTAGEKAAAEAVKATQQDRKKKARGSIAAQETQGCVVQSTVEDPGQTLFVTIANARNLRARNAEAGTSDPYCTVQIAGKVRTKKKTRVIKENLNPDWDEVFQIDDYKDGDDLVFSVKDIDCLGATGEDQLGKATLDSYQLALGFSGELELEGSGTLKVNCKLQGKDPILTVKVDHGPLGISISWRGDQGLVVSKIVPDGGIDRITNKMVKLGWRVEGVNGSPVETLEQVLHELKFRPVTVKFIGQRSEGDYMADDSRQEAMDGADADLDGDETGDGGLDVSAYMTESTGVSTGYPMVDSPATLEFPKEWRRRQSAAIGAAMELSVYSEMLEKLSDCRLMLDAVKAQNAKKKKPQQSKTMPAELQPWLQKTAENIQRRVESEVETRLAAKIESAVAGPLQELKSLTEELKAKRAAKGD